MTFLECILSHAVSFSAFVISSLYYTIIQLAMYMSVYVDLFNQIRIESEYVLCTSEIILFSAIKSLDFSEL